MILDRHEVAAAIGEDAAASLFPESEARGRDCVMALRFTRLTRLNIRALKPGEKFTEHGITAAARWRSDRRSWTGLSYDPHPAQV